MFIHRSEHCTDIYPFIDSAEQAWAADRITVWNLDMVDNPSLRVSYRGMTWTYEKFAQLVLAFGTAFEFAEDSATYTARSKGRE